MSNKFTLCYFKQLKKFTLSYFKQLPLTLFRWAFLELLTDGVGGGAGTKRPSIPKICHTLPTMMILSTVIPYLKKIQKIYESRETHPEFCQHQHFFTGNHQILLYQKTKI